MATFPAPVEPAPLSPYVPFDYPMVGSASPFHHIDGQNRDIILESIRTWARVNLLTWTTEWQTFFEQWIQDVGDYISLHAIAGFSWRYTDTPIVVPGDTAVEITLDALHPLLIGDLVSDTTDNSNYGVITAVIDDTHATVTGIGSLRGVPGPNTIPTDTAVAGLIDTTTGSLTSTAINSRTGVYSVVNYGAIADWNGTTGTDNLAAFNAAIDAATEGDTVIVPAGSYYLSGTITIGKSINFDCGSGGINSGTPGTQLVFKAATGGIQVIKIGATPPAKWRIGAFHLSSLSTTAGTDVGIFISAGRGTVENATIDSFGSHGVHIKAGTAFGGGNANLTNLSKVRSYANRGDGIRVEGTDANKAYLDHCDVVANYGWGINLISSAMCDIMGPHADQSYNGSPGAFRDAGNSNNWDWVYSENGIGFLIDTGSSNGRLSLSAYGAPAVTQTGSAGFSWRISSNLGTWRQNIINPAATQQYEIAVGGLGVDSFDIRNVTAATRIFSTASDNSRTTWFSTLAPNATNTNDLGTTSLKWKNALFAGFVGLGVYTTAARPAAATAGIGAVIYDSTLGLPIFSTGSAWKNAAGTVV